MKSPLVVWDIYMNSDHINFNWLKSREERKVAAETILSWFDDRVIIIQESQETIIERVMEDEDLLSAEAILREFKHLCVSVWRDDLTNGEPYNDIILQMNEIGNNPIVISEIKDGYPNSEPGSDFNLELTTKSTTHKATLNHGSWLDYNFLKVFLAALKASSTNGNYYAVSSDTMDEGKAFIYLSPEEHSEVLRTGIIDLNELDENYICSCAKAFYQPFKKPEIFGSLTNLSTTTRHNSKVTVEDDHTPLELNQKRKGLGLKEAANIVDVISFNQELISPQTFENIHSRKEAFRLGLTYFDGVLEIYGLTLIFDEGYEYGAAKLVNENCIIELSMDRFDLGIDVYFENPKDATRYHYGSNMYKKEVFKKEKMTPYEHLSEYGQIVQKLKNIAYLINKYWHDTLTGDFSSL